MTLPELEVKCWKCWGSGLVPWNDHGELVDCPECGGIYLDAGELDKLTAARQGLFSEAEPVLAEAAADLAASGQAVPDVRIRLSLLNSTIAFIKGNTDQALELIESWRAEGAVPDSTGEISLLKARILTEKGRDGEARSELAPFRHTWPSSPLLPEALLLEAGLLRRSGAGREAAIRSLAAGGRDSAFPLSQPNNPIA